MAVASTNEFAPKRINDLVALRAAEAAPYLTVGAKEWFKDQLAGKRDGQTYDFVIRDVAKYHEGLDMSDNVSDLKERKVTKSIFLGNVALRTNFVEAVTDINWDKEIAQPNSQAIVEGVVQKVIKSDIPLPNTAFVGKGWLPLSKASRFLSSVTSEKKYAFVDPMIDSIMSSQGKAFSPVETEPLYRTGMLGSAFGSEFREQQFMPDIEISKELADQLSSATVTSYATGAEYDTLTISATATIPAGTPLFIEGIYATNLIGNKTSALKAFIVSETASGGVLKVAKNDIDGQGTKECCNAEGEGLKTSDFGSKKLVQSIGAGHYFMGLFRANGSFEFETLDKLDWSNADATSESVQGIRVHSGRAVDVLKGTNMTRYAIAPLAGIVERRANVLVLIKDTDVNLVTL